MEEGERVLNLVRFLFGCGPAAKRFRCLCSGALLGLSALAASQVNVTTYHNDIQRTGLNSSEYTLNLSNVNSKTFGLLFSLPVDGYVYAQPLYLSGVSIPGKGVHNVVYIFTEHNSVYAFDANSNQGVDSSPLWHVNLGPSVPNNDVGTGDIVPEIGITGTPVIALPGKVKSQTPTIYLVEKTTQSLTGAPGYFQYLHALDATTGAEKFGGPVLIQAKVAGVGDGTDGNGQVPFNALIQNQRPALLLLPPSTGVGNGDLYIGWASHGDNGPYHGWLMKYSADNLKQEAVYNTTANAKTDPSGYPIAAGGIWQGGAGMASDGKSIFFATGNGTYEPSIGAYGDSILRVALDLTLQDYFTPFNEQNMDDNDGDLGSGGVMLLPSEVGSAAAPELAVQAGKYSTVYLVNTQDLGGFHSSDHIVGELPNGLTGVWGSPAYFDGKVYFGPYYSPLVAFGVNDGKFTRNGAISQSPDGYGYPGPEPAVSSNGKANGIVWAIESDQWNSGGNAYLKAYEAANLSNELYDSSTTGGRDTLGGAVKFTVPTVANGKVYVGSAYSVGVFGLGTWPANPSIVTPSGNYVNKVMVQVNEATPGAAVYYTTDGSIPTTSSNRYTVPVQLTQCTTFTVRAFLPSGTASGVATAYYQINASYGSGNGLMGNYYQDSQDPTGTPTVQQVAPVIDFNWNGNPPVTSSSWTGGGDDWAASFVGHILAENTETYTFTTYSDDGVQVWVNGQQIINDWTYHAPTYDSGTITLTGGTKYTIEVDYFQGGGGSLLYLYWAAPGMAQQIVPQSQLYNP